MASQLEGQAVMGIDPWVIIGGAVKIRRVLMQCFVLTTFDLHSTYQSPLAVQMQPYQGFAAL